MSELVMLVMLTAVLSTSDERPSVEPPAITEESFSPWMAHIRARPSELAWLEIPWIDRLADGIREAGRQEKPLLLWAMNGHPLGCT